MKTYQLILATALVALASCNKEEVTNTDVNLESNEIGFNVVNRKATKANDAMPPTTPSRCGAGSLPPPTSRNSPRTPLPTS